MNVQLRSRYKRNRIRQCGQAVLLTVVALVLGFGAVFYSFFGSARQTLSSDKVTHDALAQAKAALIGYSVNQSQPGLLPCPDTDNDGSADSPCGALGVTAIGRLPWKTLGLPDLRDGSGECLWYAVSANFKNSGTSGPATVNSDSPGTLIVYDSGGTALSSPPNPAVAIVFAPGQAFSVQDRSPPVGPATVCGGNTTAASYLEGNNAIAGTSYATGASTDTFNDKLLLVTSDALFSAVESRVAKTVLNALNSYYTTNGYYPPPAVPSHPTCLGSGTLLSTDCSSDTPPGAGTTLATGRIPNNPVPAPYGGGSDILRGDVACPSATYWFQCNGWRELTWMSSSSLCHTGQSAFCADGGGAGDLIVWWRPYGTSTTSQKVVVFVAGRAIPGNVRSTAADKTTSSNYVEAANVSGPNYDKGAVTTAFNDKVLHN